MAGEAVTMWLSAQRRARVALLGVGLGLLGVSTYARQAAAAEAQDMGEAVVVAEEGSTRRVLGGGSRTEFSIRLPRGASCPGDSAEDGYRVQSFMAPITVAPEAIQFDGLGPAPNAYGDWGSFRQPLYDTFTRPFVSALTAVAVAPGQPGPIIDIPTFTFAVYGAGELPVGQYHLGIVCTLANQPVRYWDTQIIVSGAPDDTPAGITWKLAGDSALATTSRRPVGPLVLTGSVLAVAGAAMLVRRQSRPRSTSSSTEDR